MSMPETQTQIAQDAIAAIISSTDLVTNFNPGTVIRALIDMNAAIGANIEQQAFDAFYLASINSILTITDTTPLDAQPSVYLLMFSLSSSAQSPQTLAAGTQVLIPGTSLLWSTTSPVTISPGGVSYVTAICQTPGSVGNVPANSINALQSPIANLTVTNPSSTPIVPGQDAETPTQTEARAINAIATIHRGDANSMESGALTATVTDSNGTVIEQIVSAKAYDYITPGICYLYAFNGVGNMSTQLLDNLTQIITGYIDANGVAHAGFKAAGVYVNIYNPNLYTVNIEGTVTLYPGYLWSSTESLINSALLQYFSSLNIGDALSYSQIINTISSVNGVQDVVLTQPTQTLVADPLIVAPTVAPSASGLTVTPSTSLAAGTYLVGYTYTNAWGETTISPTTSVTITANQAIQVSSLTPLPFGATGVNYYVSQTVGGNTLGLSASGTGQQINLTQVGSATVIPPVSNTATVNGTLYVPGSIILTLAS